VTGVPRTLRVASIVATTLAALSAAWLLGRSSASRNGPTFRALTFRQGYILSARFLPDGSSVVYGAAWEGSPIRAFISPLDMPDARPLDLPPADIFSVSRRGDLLLGLGRSFLFDWLTGATLARAPLAGGSPRTLLDGVRAADQDDDGELALVRVEKREHVLERPRGRVAYRTSGWIGDLRILPGGRGVAFLDHPVWGDRRGRLAIASGGLVRPLVEREFHTLSGLALAPSGREVFFSAAPAGSKTEILAASLPSGAVRSVLRAPGALRIHDATAGGTLLVSREEQRHTIGFRRDGEPERDLCWTSHAQVAALSADGRRAVLTVFDDRSGESGVTWFRDLDADAPEPLGEGDAADLSPDGRWAVAIRHGEIDSLALLPVGPGPARILVLPRAVRYHWARFTPDGSSLVVSANEPGSRIRLYRLDLATGASAPITPEGVGFLLPLTSAGDAVTSQDLDTRTRLFPLAGGPPRDVLGLLPDEDVLLWLPGDDAFLAARRNDTPLRVYRVDAATGARRLHAEVGPADRNGLRFVWPVAFSADGTAVAYNVSRLFSELFVAEGAK
jgi:hypothetical protein